MTDLEQHLIRQMVFSRATFGPGARTDGVLDHMTKEIAEVRESGCNPDEWVDLVILALDGLTRAVWSENNYQLEADTAALISVNRILSKQAKNERRDWPDWRSSDPNKAIEHVRGAHD